MTASRRGVKRTLVELRDRVDPRSLDRLAEIAGLPESVIDRETLRRIDTAVGAAVGARSVRQLAVIVTGSPVEVGSVFARRYGRAEILVIDVQQRSTTAQGPARPRRRVTIWRASTIGALHEALSTTAGLDVLIENGSGQKALKRGSLRQLLFHLRDGGLYVVAGLGSLRDPELQAGAGLDVWRAATHLMRLNLNPDLLAGDVGREEELTRAAAVGTIANDGHLITIGKSGRHALKLRDLPAETVLTARRGDAWGRRLETREPVAVRSRAKLSANAKQETFRAEFDVPRLFLREYTDVVCAPQQLVVQGEAILPISFHHGLRKGLPHESSLLRHASSAFAVLDPALESAPELPGTYFHLDSEFPGHFGHLVTEDIAKLWAWPAAQRAYPELKVLLSTDEPGGTVPQHHLVLFEALGVPPERVVCIDRPVRVQRLLGASQMFYNGSYVHPELPAIWDRLRERLGSPDRDRPATPKRIFVTREPELRRPCRNAAEVEALFVEHGFALVRPELMSIREQVDLFAEAEFIAGYGGSGMLNAIYSRRPGRRVVIASNTYVARNEWMIASMKGDDYHHFFCDSEATSAHGPFTYEQFHAGYSFDFARDGAALEVLLKEAPPGASGTVG